MADKNFPSSTVDLVEYGGSSPGYTMVVPAVGVELGITHVLSALKSHLVAIQDVSGSSREVSGYILDGAAAWIEGIIASTLESGYSSNVVLARSKIVTFYVIGSVAHLGHYDLGTGETEVVSLGTATMGVHCYDPIMKRIVAALLNSTWKAVVVTPDSDGAFTQVSSQVDMALSGTPKTARGSLLILPSGEFNFLWIKNDNTAQMVQCSDLDNDGNGTWQ